DGADQVVPAHVADTYVALLKSGELKQYTTLAITWDQTRGLEQIPDILAASERLAKEGVEAKSVKIFMDGVPVQRTAALIEPYADQPGFLGDLFIDLPQFEEAVAQLDAKGMQVHVHAIGDRAVRAAADAFVKARERN